MVGPMFSKDELYTKRRDRTQDALVEKIKAMLIELAEEGYLGR